MDYYTDVLKKYVVFQGRATRREYWMFTLINVLVSIAVGIIAAMVHIDGLRGLYSLATLLPSLAVAARRLHDADRSAWWLLLCLLPIIGWIILIVFLASPTKPGATRFDTSAPQA